MRRKARLPRRAAGRRPLETENARGGRELLVDELIGEYRD